MSPDELAAIQARADAATPGPWLWDGDGYPDPCPHGTEWTNHGPDLRTSAIKERAGNSEWNAAVIHSYGYDASGLDIERSDAEFIAHAREDIPALLAEIARLRAALEATA